jgi:hypothetical protein
MTRLPRRLTIVLPVLATVVGLALDADGRQPLARQTFSIHVPGKVEVKSVGRQPDGTPATIRVTGSERVEVVVERRSPASSKMVPVLRSRITGAGDSLTIPAMDVPLNTPGDARPTVILTIVPLH